MGLSQKLKDAEHIETDSTTNLNDIYEELVSIKFAMESVEQMAKCACQIAISIIGFMIVGFFWWKFL